MLNSFPVISVFLSNTKRSFGEFDPETTALYKMKSGMDDCPPVEQEIEAAKDDGEIPNPYYFERGDHRDDISSELMTSDSDIADRMMECSTNFFTEMGKEREDIIKGYVLEYNETCGLAMVSMNRVDRDYGPKSIDANMIEFLDGVYYNTSITDMKEYIDTDQWIKNLAAYAVTLNLDSVIMNINNWYVATTDGGKNDWKLVQYDHNNVASRDMSMFCSGACGSRQIYWPILRPTCDAMDNNRIVGRILNDDASMETYLKYVQEFITMIHDTSVLEDLRQYGHKIKQYVPSDPFYEQAGLFGDTSDGSSSVEDKYDYETSELSENYDDYNSPSMPFVKVLAARIDQVQAQLDAIADGTLPRDGIYGPNEKCPDWRDPSGDSYISGSSFDASCGLNFCEEAAPCYDNSPMFCNPDGTLAFDECKAASPFCDNCFPYSKCGGGSINSDDSAVFVEDDEVCGPAVSDCSKAYGCFDHLSVGACAYDGEILTEECNLAEQYCKPCYPNSRCGTTSLLLDAEDNDELPASSADTSDDSNVVTSTGTEEGEEKEPVVAEETPTEESTEEEVLSSSASTIFTGLIGVCSFTVVYFSCM